MIDMSNLLPGPHDAIFMFEYSIEYPDVPLYLRVSEYIVRLGAFQEETRIESKSAIPAPTHIYDPVEVKRRCISWTEKELAFMRENYGRMPAREMAEAAGRSYIATKQKARKMGLAARRNKSAWTKEEMAILREHYRGTLESKKKVAKLTGRTVSAVKTRACVMGVASLFPCGNPKYWKNHSRIPV